jgi:hypothetical protein
MVKGVSGKQWKPLGSFFEDEIEGERGLFESVRNFV